MRGKLHVLNGVLGIDKNVPKLNFSISLVASCEGGHVVHPVSARWRWLSSSGIDGAAVASSCTLDSGRRHRVWKLCQIQFSHSDPLVTSILSF